MKRVFVAVLLVTAGVPVAVATAAGPVGEDLPVPVPVGERVYVLAMERSHFNGQTWPDTPLLEAYAGERMHVFVHVPLGAEMHTFHLHGHPWEDPDSGQMIDTVLLNPGEVHRFSQTAGLGEGFAGDWLYHCHVSSHFEEGMWGVLRVYEHSMSVEGGLDALTVEVTDRHGVPVEGASISARWNPDAPRDPVPGQDDQARPVPVSVEETSPGTYRVVPELASVESGELVIISEHAQGESVARLSLAPGGYEVNRHVGVGQGVDEKGVGGSLLGATGVGGVRG